MNAARTIAYQIKNAITTLLYNVMLAIQPQATQLYAKGEFNSFFKMLFVGARVVVFFYLSIAFPVYFYIEDILSIWLTTVPEHTIAFCTDYINLSCHSLFSRTDRYILYDYWQVESLPDNGIYCIRCCTPFILYCSEIYIFTTI